MAILAVEEGKEAKIGIYLSWLNLCYDDNIGQQLVFYLSGENEKGKVGLKKYQSLRNKFWILV